MFDFSSLALFSPFLFLFLLLFCFFIMATALKRNRTFVLPKDDKQKNEKQEVSTQNNNTTNVKSKREYYDVEKEFNSKISDVKTEIPKEKAKISKSNSLFAEEDILRITKTHTLVFAEQEIDESDIGSSDIECQALCDCDYNPMNDDSDSIEEIDVTATADSSWAETMDKYREEKVETEYEIKKEIIL